MCRIAQVESIRVFLCFRHMDRPLAVQQRYLRLYDEGLAGICETNVTLRTLEKLDSQFFFELNNLFA